MMVWWMAVLREKLVALQVNANIFYSDKELKENTGFKTHTKKNRCICEKYLWLVPHAGCDQSVELREVNVTWLF